MNKLSKTMIAKGFSLIELMVVIAVIGILAAIAVPSYKNYVIRTRLVEAISIADSVKPRVIKAYSKEGVMPNDGSGPCPSPPQWKPTNSPFVQATSAYSGTPTKGYIHACLSGAVYPGSAGKFILIEAIGDANGNLTFKCGTDSRAMFQIPLEYLPKTCNTLITVQ